MAFMRFYKVLIAMIRRQIEPVFFGKALPLLLALGVLSACASRPPLPDSAAKKPVDVAAQETDVTALGRRFGMSDDMYYHLVVAELAGQYEDFGNAANAYGRVLDIAGTGGLSQEDQYLLARRAWEIGRYSKNGDLAERAAQAWQQQDDSFTPRLARVVAVESASKEAQQAVLAAVLDLPTKQRAEFAAVLAKQYAGTAQSEDALLFIEDWLEQQPDDVDMLLVGAQIAEQSGATAMAYQWWFRHAALSADPNVAFNSRAHAAANLRLLGEPAEAANLLRDLHHQNPSEDWVTLEYGRALLQSRQVEASVDALQRLATKLDNNAEVLYLAGFANYAAEHFVVAAEYFEKALANGYSEHDARYWIGIAKLAGDKPKQAIEWLGTLGQGQYWLGSQKLIGNALAELGAWEEFEAHFDGLRSVQPEQAGQWYMAQAQSLIAVKQLDKAVALLDKAVAVDVDDLNIRYQRGLLNAALNHFVLAEADLKLVVESDPESANALNALGYMLIDSLGDPEQGLPLVKRALALEPESAAVMDSYGWGLLLQGNLNDALHWLKKAWDSRKDHEIGAHLGEALWRKQYPEKARVIWREALTLPQAGRENKVLQAYERLGIDAD